MVSIYQAWKKRYESASGETLLEVVISISVLMIAMTPASGAIISSIRNTALNRNNVIATPFAREGLAMVRFFRDSNLMNFSADKENCWNMKPKPDLNGCSNENNKIGNTSDVTNEQHFRLTTNPDTDKWDLETETADLLATPGSQGNIERYRLKQDDGLMPNGELRPGFYFSPPPELLGLNPIRGTDTQFFRQINIKYTDFDGDSVPDAMKVTAIVSFPSGTKPQFIKRSTVLFKP